MDVVSILHCLRIIPWISIVCDANLQLLTMFFALQ